MGGRNVLAGDSEIVTTQRPSAPTGHCGTEGSDELELSEDHDGDIAGDPASSDAGEGGVVLVCHASGVFDRVDEELVDESQRALLGAAV